MISWWYWLLFIQAAGTLGISRVDDMQQPQQHVLISSSGGGSSSFDEDTLNSEEFDKLVMVSKLIDITYCISSVTHIQRPFRCASNCDEFPNMELVHQWTTTVDLDDDAVAGDRVVITGYISIDHTVSTWYIGLRGTRSATDAIADLNIDQVNYPWLNCTDCFVHKGFYDIFENTLLEIEMIINLLVLDYPDYKIMIMGHSMGAAVSNLLSLWMKDTYDDDDRELHIDCITFGQPKLGNCQFANLVNSVFNLTGEVDPRGYYGSQSEFQRMKMYRVTNIGDPVVALPYSIPDDEGDGEDVVEYVHSRGELCITKMNTNLAERDVAICSHVCPPDDASKSYSEDCQDPRCRKKLELWGSNSHLMYFKILGACNFGF